MRPRRTRRIRSIYGSAWLSVGFLKINNTMTEEIKKLKSELKEWQSQEVQERFKRVNSLLPIVIIKELKYKILRLKRGEDI